MNLPRPHSRGIFSPRFGREILPKRKGLRVHSRAYARGFPRRGIILTLYLIVTLFLGAFLVFYKLGSIPSGLYVDEAVTGYNAYSILKTGKDEYGEPFPIAFRFFGSYSPPVYTYASTFSINFFGLNAFSVRFISALSGVLSILVVFLFLKSLNITKTKTGILFGTLLFAISPWHILYSRTGYESNLAFLFFAIGILFFWKSVKNPFLIIISLPILSLATYTDHTQRFLVPLFFLIILVYFRNWFFKKSNIKYTTIGLFLSFLIQIPNLSIVFTPAFISKSSLFYSSTILTQAQKISFIPFPVAVIFSFFREFLAQYINYFSPESLFFLPDPDPQRSMPNLAAFYPWMVIPYLIGFFFLLKKAKQKPEYKFLLILAVLAPIPASLSKDPFSTQRAIPLLLPLIAIITIGIDDAISKVKLFWLPVFATLTCFSLLMLWRSYFVFLPQERAQVWSYGFQELAKKIQENDEHQFLIDQSRIKPAYIELAFFLKYPPEKIQEGNKEIKDNYYHNINFDAYHRLGNIETRNINWEKDIYKEQILIGDELAFSENQIKDHFLEKVFEIKDPLNRMIFQAYKTNPQEKCKIDKDQPACNK